MACPPGSASTETVQSFYVTLLSEVEQPHYDEAEKSMFANRRLYYGRYLHPHWRNYFVETVIPHIAHAVAFLVREQPPPRILDLGCGLGMQSIIFASLGARVVGVDLREKAIALCKKRKAYYEERLQTKLDIEFVHRDFLESRPEDFDSQFDSVFSMSGFSNILPLERTVKLISAVLKPDARIYLYEINPSHPVHLLRKSPEPSPACTVEAFSREGFRQAFLYGTCALPGPFWKCRVVNQTLVHPANNLLKKSLPLSFNYVLGLERGRV